MNRLHNLSWITAALLATVLAAGCERNSPSGDTAGQKLDRTTERAEQKMDQAAADMKQKAGEAKDKMADATITAKVKSAMIGQPELKALQINVDTDNGVVTLTGTVDTPQKLELATQVAQGVEGVKSVDNRLSMKGKA
jgi:hyperosmotically inducible protein